MKNKWEIVHDCDDDQGNPTTYSLKTSDGKYYWICKAEFNTFDVIDHDACTILKNCKNLSSAKRWVTINLL